MLSPSAKMCPCLLCPVIATQAHPPYVDEHYRRPTLTVLSCMPFLCFFWKGFYTDQNMSSERSNQADRPRRLHEKLVLLQNFHHFHEIGTATNGQPLGHMNVIPARSHGNALCPHVPSMTMLLGGGGKQAQIQSIEQLVTRA